jgi:myo-inositol-1(or 4)-monophosphatase
VIDIQFVDAAVRAARLAGAVLQEWADKFTVKHKSHAADLVTEADLAAQNVIYDALHGQFADHGFLGEEGLQHDGGASAYRWVIDPLDGTSNYVHGYPAYAVSIGLEHRDELVAGVIFDPNTDEMFTAAKGQGAALNGKPLHVSDADQLSQSMLVASFPPGVKRDGPEIARFLNVLPQAQTIHRTGSAALNLAYIAAGRMEGYWSTSLKPWDMAAGVLIIREAGGQVTACNGQPWVLEDADLLVTNGTAIHAELIELLT